MIQNKIALTGGLIIDGRGGRAAIGTLIIEGDKIKSIDNVLPENDCAVINISGCTALPGFIHAHAHPGFKQIGNTDLNDYELGWLEACLSAGITTVKDMGALDGCVLTEILARRDALNASGNYPTIISAGKFFAAPGGYGGAAPVTVATEREAREKVQWAIASGADFIKTSLENGFSPDTMLPKLSKELLTTICTTARTLGCRVAAHLSQCGPLRTLVESGITDAGHVPYDRMDDELIGLMVSSGVSLTPTLTLYRMLSEKYGAPFLETALDNTRRFALAGGVIAVGDDYIEPEAPWYRPGLPMGELELLSQAGLNNTQIIKALTAGGAEVCGLGSVTGELAAGKLADVVVVRGNPLEDLHCLKDVAVVASKGKIIVHQMQS